MEKKFSIKWVFAVLGLAIFACLYSLSVYAGDNHVHIEQVNGGKNVDIDITQMDEDQLLTVEWDGDDADIDIIQKSGTCPTGVASCSGIVNLDVDSEGATVTINQKDTSD